MPLWKESHYLVGRSSRLKDTHNIKSGEIIKKNSNVYVKTGDGFYVVKEIQYKKSKYSGKKLREFFKRMNVTLVTSYGWVIEFSSHTQRVHSYIVLSGPIFVLFLGFLLKFSFFNLFFTLIN